MARVSMALPCPTPPLAGMLFCKEKGVFGGSNPPPAPRDVGTSFAPNPAKGSHPPTPPRWGVLPHPPYLATREDGASFVQRSPRDSEKGGAIAACESGASFGMPLPGAAAKRAGGWAKTWGVWGVSPHMEGKALHMQGACQKRGVEMWGAPAEANARGGGGLPTRPPPALAGAKNMGSVRGNAPHKKKDD